MQANILKRCEVLEEKIVEFEQCEDFQQKGLLLNECYQLCNPMLKDILNQQMSVQARIMRSKNNLVKLNKVFIQRIEFDQLNDDARKLTQILQHRNATKNREVQQLTKDIHVQLGRVDRTRLSFKEQKLLDDIQHLVVRAETGTEQEIMKLSQALGQSNLVELESNKVETEQLKDVLHEIHEMNRLQGLINTEVAKQQTGLEKFDEVHQLVSQDIDSSEREYIVTHMEVMSLNRKKIEALLASIFSFLSYFKGFGAAIGGAVGFVIGGFVASVSQYGLEKKVQRQEEVEKPQLQQSEGQALENLIQTDSIQEKQTLQRDTQLQQQEK